MSEQAFKKLAELSFDDLYVEEKEELFPEVRQAVGRVYASIHRRSTRMPQSLQTQIAPTMLDEASPAATFVLPRLKQA